MKQDIVSIAHNDDKTQGLRKAAFPFRCDRGSITKASCFYLRGVVTKVCDIHRQSLHDISLGACSNNNQPLMEYILFILYMQ
jgi:hypothetical protein